MKEFTGELVGNLYPCIIWLRFGSSRLITFKFCIFVKTTINENIRRL